MGRLFVLAFALLPLLEIAFFILIGRAIGLWPTLLGVAVTALAGAVIIRIQGVSLLGEIRSALREGRLPARELLDAAIVAIAGLLLLLPGYFSDLVGLLLLVPPIRTVLYRVLGARLVGAVVPRGPGGRARPGSGMGRILRRPGVIDLDDDQYRPR